MIPRIKFSIKVELEFFAAAHVKREGRKKQNRRADVNHVQHNFPNTQRCHDERDNAATFLSWVNLRPRTSRIRGSPFQLPARLAVGLGLESRLETGSPASFAPSSSCLEEFGSPAPGLRKEAGFRLQRRKKNIFVSLCQISNEISRASDWCVVE